MITLFPIYSFFNSPYKQSLLVYTLLDNQGLPLASTIYVYDTYIGKQNLLEYRTQIIKPALNQQEYNIHKGKASNIGALLIRVYIGK